jgi:UDP-N-acetylmuramyl pentapeptide phosphotransferase/UDP-N-acetylglucosamine-1-phosphate transferase
VNGDLAANATAAIGGLLFAWLPIAFTSTPWGPTAINYRGRRLMVVLGLLIISGIAGALLPRWIGTWIRHADWSELQAAMVGGSLLVGVAGLYDDLRGGQVRGLRGHFRELRRGRVSSGVVKILGATGGATLVAAVVGGGSVRLLLGVLVMAGCANLWNLLDVAPGRALKYFLLAALALVGLEWHSDFARFGAAGIGAALFVFPSDLRERGMLGDAGSNVLGFIVGVGLLMSLPTWALWVALAAILILHALGETVTLSRIIEATPPLRWFDRLGRLPLDEANRESTPPTPDSSAT